MKPLTMSVKERRRVEILSRVRDGGLSLRSAAEQMGVSERQAWRLKHRYAKDHDAGLVHGLRGRMTSPAPPYNEPPNARVALLRNPVLPAAKL